MSPKHHRAQALQAAFPYTIPILTGFVFLGIAYGYYMTAEGFHALYPIMISLTVYAGSMEFVTVGLLKEAFDPLRVLMLTLMINARHLFYGVAMLDKYRAVGRKKFFLIYGMADETFSVNCAAEIPPGVDKGWFMLWVTVLDYCYWQVGTMVGAALGSVVRINTEGLSFVLTALFVVLFLEQWRKEKTHHSALLGLGATLACLLIFGNQNFIIPAMLVILAGLTLLRKPLAKEGESL
ncbi:MAG TPA: AzlC family ABC transporter permease [Candidatus Limiplasma sp.]|nr:AzlC family ABC transporter permease [Candidatus Limiplasma sp.]HRX08196.1 AzlC family ABC transporter permease [Candidatus Limiplasma sp.]